MTYMLTADQLADIRGDLGIRNVQVVILTGNPTGGTFTLTYGGQTTAAIAYDATELAVQAALQALSTVGSLGCTVTGVGGQSQAGGPYTCIFQRDDGTVLTAASSLTGGTAPAVTVSATPVFSDTELNRYFDRASGDYNLAVYYACRALLGNAHKLAVYTLGLDGVNKQVIFGNIKAMLQLWADISGASGGELQSGVISLGLDMTSADLDTFGSSDV